jgi:hypothetical protein
MRAQTHLFGTNLNPIISVLDQKVLNEFFVEGRHEEIDTGICGVGPSWRLYVSDL